MDAERLGLLLFYCWQLKINTAGELKAWKQSHNATTNAQTLEEMQKAFNGEEWARINKKK
jgi:hypothetical protein